MPYLETTITAGKVRESTKYHTAKYKSEKRPKAKNRTPTPDQQAKINERNALKKLYHLINANFVANDNYLTLTYSEKPPEPEEAKKHLSRFIRKLRELYKKMGAVLKYIAVTEYKKRRIHHHLLINQVGIGINHIKKFWQHGFVKAQLYAGEPDDAERLANYLIKESNNTFNAADKVHGLRWVSSKNLIHPQVETKVVSAGSWREDPKPPKGYYIACVKRGFTQTNYPYMFCRMIKIESGGETDGSSSKVQRNTQGGIRTDACRPIRQKTGTD